MSLRWHNFHGTLSQHNRYVRTIIISPYHGNRLLRIEFINPLGAMFMGNIQMVIRPFLWRAIIQHSPAKFGHFTSISYNRASYSLLFNSHNKSLAYNWLRAWASCQIRKIVGCACAGNAGNVFPASNLTGNRYLANPACITARALRTCRAARLDH